MPDSLNLQMTLSLEVGAVMHTHSNFSEKEMEAHRVVNYQGRRQQRAVAGGWQWQAGGSGTGGFPIPPGTRLQLR